MRNDIDFRLYLVTNRKHLVKTSHFSLLTSHFLPAVECALKGGVKAIQLREKDLGTRELLKLAYKMRDLTKRYKAKLFINDRLDIALAVGADGVHLTQQSIPADAVRRAVKGKLLIGVSVHSMKEAEDAEKRGADFITLGPVYKTTSKLKYGAPLGIDAFKKVTAKIKIPVFAIGGVKINRINELKKAGAFGAAMISGIFETSNIRCKTEKLIKILSK